MQAASNKVKNIKKCATFSCQFTSIIEWMEIAYNKFEKVTRKVTNLLQKHIALLNDG